MTTELPAWVDAQRKNILDLYDATESLKSGDHELIELCEILVAVSEFKTSMALIYDSVNKLVAEKFDREQIVNLPSGAYIERRFSKDRKGWKHKELANIVAQRIQSMSIDLDTGEVLLSTEEMISKLLDFMQPSYWRVGALNEIGLNPDDFCTTVEDKETISVRKPK